MTAVTVDARGVVTLEIAAPDGEVSSYLLARAPDGLDAYAVTVSRTDGEASYRTALGCDGRWRCSCPSYRYRKGPDGRRLCKHVDAVKALLRLVEELEP